MATQLEKEALGMLDHISEAIEHAIADYLRDNSIEELLTYGEGEADLDALKAVGTLRRYLIANPDIWDLPTSS